MLYLLHEAPPEEQNFPMVMEMIAAAEVHEDDDNYQSPLDILFERLEMREPDSICLLYTSPNQPVLKQDWAAQPPAPLKIYD